MGGFDAVGDIGAQQDAEDGEDGHDGEDDLVAVDALMDIEDEAVDADEHEIHEMPWRPLNADSYLIDLKYKKILEVRICPRYGGRYSKIQYCYSLNPLLSQLYLGRAEVYHSEPLCLEATPCRGDKSFG